MISRVLCLSNLTKSRLTVDLYALFIVMKWVFAAKCLMWAVELFHAYMWNNIKFVDVKNYW